MSAPVHLVGRLTRDPDLRFTSKGDAVASFTVVTSRRFLNKQTNEWEDADTSFWDCSVFRQTAEHVAESLQQGMEVIVHGKIAQREYETREGEKRKTVQVTVDAVGPSLRFQTAKVSKTSRSNGAAPPAGFGGGAQPGPQPDPWASGQPDAPAAPAAGFSDEPPF
jgi:single-strand DNA-binding protein